MITWKYVAKRIADEFSSPPGLGHWTDAHLLRTWNTLFDFRFELYHDPASMHGNYAKFFDYFMTLASRPQWTDEEKVKSMSSLLEELTTGRYDRTKFLTMLNKGGYDTSKLELSIASMD